MFGSGTYFFVYVQFSVNVVWINTREET